MRNCVQNIQKWPYLRRGGEISVGACIYYIYTVWLVPVCTDLLSESPFLGKSSPVENYPCPFLVDVLFGQNGTFWFIFLNTLILYLHVYFGGEGRQCVCMGLESVFLEHCLHTRSPACLLYSFSITYILLTIKLLPELCYCVHDYPHEFSNAPEFILVTVFLIGCLDTCGGPGSFSPQCLASVVFVLCSGRRGKRDISYTVSLIILLSSPWYDTNIPASIWKCIDGFPPCPVGKPL